VGKQDCVFCRIIGGEEGSYKVYEDDHAIIILDKYPVSDGHALVITKRHVEGVDTASPAEAAYAFTLASALARIYKTKMGAYGVNVVTNSGRVAGQEIFHFHIHVIPWWSSERRRWGPRGILTPEKARETSSKLSEYAEYISMYVDEAGIGGV